jgi:hypothetical protein
VLKFTPKAAIDAREFLFHPSQLMEPQPDEVAYSSVSRWRNAGDVLGAGHMAGIRLKSLSRGDWQQFYESRLEN